MGSGIKRVSVAGLWLVACSGGGSDGKSSSLDSEDKDAAVEVDGAPAEEPDAGPADEPDAAPGEEPDAAPAPDAATPDAGPAFQFDVVFEGVPAEPLRVLLQDATGATSELLTTDAAGHVESDTAPAFATVLLRSNSSGNFFNPPMPFTYVGIEPGDHLRMRVRDGGYNPDRAARGELEVSVPAVALESPWNTVQLEMGNGTCYYGSGNTASYGSAEGEVQSPMTLGNFEECTTSPLNLLGRVVDVGESEQVAGYSYLRSVPAPPPDGSLSVTLPAWADPGYLTIEPTNLDARYPGVSGSVHMLADGERYEAELRRVPVASALDARPMPFAQGFGDALEVMGFAGANTTPGNVSFLQVITRVPEAANVALDFALPDTTAIDSSIANGLTLGRTLSGELAGADAQIFALVWIYDTGDGFVPAPWYVVAPADLTSFDVPSPDTSDFTVDIEQLTFERVVTVSDDGLAGYEAFKDRTAFIDLARGIPSQYAQRLEPATLGTLGFDLQSAIDLAPRGNGGTVRITGRGTFPLDTTSDSARVIPAP